MDFIEFFLQKSGIESPEQQESLKLQITLNSLGLAITKIHPHLSEEERAAVKEFLEKPSEVTGQKVQSIFSKPECQEMMADATLEVVRELVDDPKIISSEQQKKILLHL